MTKILLKRVYEPAEKSDGYRILVDRLWPRGVKKERLEGVPWAKELAPCGELRKWFHEEIDTRWPEFCEKYRRELDVSQAAHEFALALKSRKTVTLLYASKDPVHLHAVVLKQFLEDVLEGA